MKLYFKVPPKADGMLLRGFLRRCSVSTDLSRAVKFRGSGFFADGAPILANRRVEAGQVISFELPPEGEGVAPQDNIPVDVVYEDAFALVVEKPPHLAVHPTLNYPLDTLANGYAAWALRQGRSPVFRPVSSLPPQAAVPHTSSRISSRALLRCFIMFRLLHRIVLPSYAAESENMPLF